MKIPAGETVGAAVQSATVPSDGVPAAAVPSAAVPSTPTIRGAARQWRFWIIAIVAVLLIALAGIALTGTAKAGNPFSATNPAPGGSMAIAEVLKSRGVDVRVPATFAAAESDARSSTSDTLFLYDPENRLSDSRLRELAALASAVVVLTPTFAQLQSLVPEVSAAGAVTRTTLESRCAVPPAARAGAVTAAGMGYRVVSPGTNVTGCFASRDGVFSLIEVTRATQNLTVLGTTDALTNEHVAAHGNAALALSVLGQNDRVIWYLPTIDDSTTAPSLAALTPSWVGSVSSLLIIAAIAAAFWRGRRFGPLVIEALPVIVRASETMEGRARLYQRNGSRLRALDALRIGSIGRLATLCGLPRVAPVEDVIQSVATATGRDAAAVRSLLIDADPSHDRELVRLSDALLELEGDVARDIRPS